MVAALKRGDRRVRRFKDPTSRVMCPQTVALAGVEAMSARTSVASLVVLAVLMSPAALAQEPQAEQAWETVGLAEETLGVELDARERADAAATGEPGVTVVGVTLLGPPPRREAAPQETSSAPSSEGEPAPHDEAQPGERPSRGGLFGTGRPLADPLAGPLPLGLGDALGALPSGLPLAAPQDEPVARASAAAPGPARASAPSAMQAPVADAVPEAAHPAALVALASAAAVASVAAGPGAFDWERVRRFGFAALLYTRIAKDRLLDHARRETLLGAIRDRPGMTLSDVAESTGIPRNTATYHLNRLEKEGMVTSARQGRARLYFVVGGDARKAQADAFAALRHDNGRALALAVGASPGVDQQALCAKLGLQPSLVHWHADRLLAAGVLRKEREGRHVRYHPGPAFPLVAASEAAPASGTPAQAC